MADATVAMVGVVETSLRGGGGVDEGVDGVVTIFPLTSTRKVRRPFVSYSERVPPPVNCY